MEISFPSPLLPRVESIGPVGRAAEQVARWLSVLSHAPFLHGGCGPDSRLHLRGGPESRKRGQICLEFVDRFLPEKKPRQQNTELDGRDKLSPFNQHVSSGNGIWRTGGRAVVAAATARRGAGGCLCWLDYVREPRLPELRRAPRRLLARTTYRFLSTIIPLSAPAAIAARDRTTGEDGRSVSVGCEAFTPARTSSAQDMK